MNISIHILKLYMSHTIFNFNIPNSIEDEPEDEYDISIIANMNKDENENQVKVVCETGGMISQYEDEIKDSPSWNAWYGRNDVQPNIKACVEIEEQIEDNTNTLHNTTNNITTADFNIEITNTFLKKSCVHIKQHTRYMYIFKTKLPPRKFS